MKDKNIILLMEAFVRDKDKNENLDSIKMNIVTKEGKHIQFSREGIKNISLYNGYFYSIDNKKDCIFFINKPIFHYDLPDLNEFFINSIEFIYKENDELFETKTYYFKTNCSYVEFLKFFIKHVVFEFGNIKMTFKKDDSVIPFCTIVALKNSKLNCVEYFTTSGELKKINHLPSDNLFDSVIFDFCNRSTEDILLEYI